MKHKHLIATAAAAFWAALAVHADEAPPVFEPPTITSEASVTYLPWIILAVAGTIIVTAVAAVIILLTNRHKKG